MKSKNNTLLLTSILVMTAIWAFAILYQNTKIFEGIDLIIFILIILLSAVALYRSVKKNKEEKEGFVPDDELSKLIKYKSGYYAYMASMYMWLFIFLLRNKFPDTETMLGGGILLSALVAFIVKIIVKKRIHE